MYDNIVQKGSYDIITKLTYIKIFIENILWNVKRRIKIEILYCFIYLITWRRTTASHDFLIQWVIRNWIYFLYVLLRRKLNVDAHTFSQHYTNFDLINHLKRAVFLILLSTLAFQRLKYAPTFTRVITVI